MNMDSLRKKILKAELNISSCNSALLTSTNSLLQPAARGGGLCLFAYQCSVSCSEGCASTSCSQGSCASSSCATCARGCSTGASNR